MRLGVAKVERIHDHADIGGVLARHPDMRNVDQLERRLMHGGLEILVAAPVAIGLPDDDIALDQQALQHFPYIERRVFRIADAEGDILEIAE